MPPYPAQNAFPRIQAVRVKKASRSRTSFWVWSVRFCSQCRRRRR